jgi:hypothetical protein
MDSQIDYIVKNLQYHTSINDNKNRSESQDSFLRNDALLRQYLGYNLPLNESINSKGTTKEMLNYHTSIEQKPIIDIVKEKLLNN